MPTRCARSHAAILLLLCFGTLATGCERPPARLNLIVILIDTLRADHVGYAGHFRDTTPHLDALAERSVIFFQHASQASRTGPSVASLFTGLHPLSHGVMNPLSHFDAKGTLDPSQQTLAEILSEAGYLSAGFTANANVSAHFGFDQGFARFESLRWRPANEINQRVLSWLDAREADVPFFLYIHYFDPHSPYDAPPQYRARFVDPDYQGNVRGTHEQLDRIVAGRLTLSETDVEQLQALYDAEIRFLDDQIGILLEHLEALDFLDESLLVVLSDHGEEFLDHDSVLHGYTLYEEQIRIPLLIHYPGILPARVETPTRQIDVMPTILELLGIDQPTSVQGRSLVKMMRGVDDDPNPRPVLAEASLRAVKTVEASSFRMGRWKLIETRIPALRHELFDLSRDPEERNNLADAEPERLQRMSEAMKRFRGALPIGRSETVELSEEEISELRALGYLPE